MYRKLICLSFVLMLGLIGSASADTVEWNDADVGDSLWSNGNNWDPTTGPDFNDIAQFEADATGTNCLVNSNQIIKLLNGPGYRDNCVMDANNVFVSGVPSTLTIEGATLTVTVYAWPAYDANGWGVIDVNTGGTLDVTQALYLGNNGICRLNMNGGTVNARSLRVGVGSADSVVNLNSGNIDANGIGVGSNGLVDITGGTLNLIDGDFRNSVTVMTYDGAIVAYGGRGRVVSVYDTVSDPCKTIVTGVQDLAVAYDPNIIGVTGVTHDAILTWKAGDGAVSHNVYLSTEFNDVNEALSPADDCFVGNYAVDHNYVDDAFLEFDSVIYWRVDEVGVSTVRGNIWRFTTGNGRAWNPKPADTTVDVNVIDLQFEWDRAPGRNPSNEYPVKYNVYFSEDFDEVNEVEVDNTGVSYCIASDYDPNSISRSIVKLNTTYWWRIDTIATADPCTVRGDVWSCTTINYYNVDTFETYRLSEDMEDYWDDTGSVYDYYKLDPDFPYSGFKCVGINFYTGGYPYYGGVERTHVPTTLPWNLKAPTWDDWTFGGTAESLSFWFGPQTNDPNLSSFGIKELYARITDSSDREALVNYTDKWPVTNFDNSGHQEWNIGLQEFKDDNINIDLTNVKTLEIGFLDGLDNPPDQVGLGWIYFDQIRLYARRCIESYGLPFADLNDDCLVNGDDLEIMGNDWLHFDYSMDARPVDPCDPNLVAHWKLDEDQFSPRAEDSSGNDHHGIITEGPITWDPNGRIGAAMDKPDEGSNAHLNAQGGKEAGDPNTWADITGDITLTAWIRPDFQGNWRQLDSVVGKGREQAWEMHKSTTNTSTGMAQYSRSMSMYVDVPGSPWYGIHALQDCWDYKWHHFAGVYKIYEPGVSSAVIVYTDGVLENTYPLWGGPMDTCNQDITIGTNGAMFERSQYHHNWWGKIDDVRIYDRALDHDEIVGLVKEGTVGPLVHYPFDDGTANDISGNDKHGSLLSGATIVYDFDRESNVLDVGDANGYVDCGGGHDLDEPNCTLEPDNCTWADILGEFTVMAWVKPSMTERGWYCGTVVSKGDWDGGYHRNYPTDPNRNREGWSMIRQGWNNEVSISIVGSGDEESRFTAEEGMDLDLMDVNVWDGKWHHIAAVWDNLTRIEVYADGLHVAGRWVRGWDDPQTIGTCNYPIFIGASSGEIKGGGVYGDPATGWKGLIDDVRIYDRSLTQIEIASVMADADLYVPLDSLANLYDLEGTNSKIINFKDYQLLATEWLEDWAFPFVP